MSGENALLISPCYKWDSSTPAAAPGILIQHYNHGNPGSSKNDAYELRAYLREGCVTPLALPNDKAQWQGAQLTTRIADNNDYEGVSFNFMNEPKGLFQVRSTT